MKTELPFRDIWRVTDAPSELSFQHKHALMTVTNWTQQNSQEAPSNHISHSPILSEAQHFIHHEADPSYRCAMFNDLAV